MTNKNMINILIHRGIALGTLALGLIAMAPIPAEAQGFGDRFENLRNRGRATWEITRPGNYTLRRDFRAREGDAIVISASNVNLNLNGFAVSPAEGGTGRGIVIDGADCVTIRNGKVGGFQTNVAVLNSENSKVSDLLISGEGLAPAGGPSEIGIMIIDGRAITVRKNNISSVNLGIFVRGGGSTGNRIEKNVLVGGTTDANNLFGICYNPAPNAGPEGPSGDSIYNNHIARFNYAVSVSDGSLSNLFVDNTLSSFTGPFANPSAFEAQGGTNAEFDNASTIIATTPVAP
ncbi:MAG: NosD domain-containing protein [Verrucomicrobiota bacterium]